MRPPGFHEAAVASSATAMKAPMPNALAPEPTGLGDEAISIVSMGWAKAVAKIGADVAMDRSKKQNRMPVREIFKIAPPA